MATHTIRYEVLVLRDGLRIGEWSYRQRRSAMTAARLLVDGNNAPNVAVEVRDHKEQTRIYP